MLLPKTLEHTLVPTPALSSDCVHPSSHRSPTSAQALQLLDMAVYNNNFIGEQNATGKKVYMLRVYRPPFLPPSRSLARSLTRSLALAHARTRSLALSLSLSFPLSLPPSLPPSPSFRSIVSLCP